jgi:type IV fimbrial biogenesis protein FimT
MKFRFKEEAMRHHHSNIKNSHFGFSLTELIISIAIVAILSSIAAPSFASMIEDRRVSASSESLISILTHARYHALSTGSTVVVCNASDPSLSKCSESRLGNSRWPNGAISYADKNDNGELDATDKILRTIQNNESVSIVFNQRGRLRFFASGGSRSAGFYLCSEGSPRERHLKILHTGRTRSVEKMSDIQRATCLSKLS